MAFVSVNELENFSFEDCQISEVSFENDKIIFSLEALLVRANNSQNSNYTESYADKSILTLEDAKILSIIEEGYRTYDAEDRLVDEVPDKEIEEIKYEELISSFGEQYLCMAQCEEKTKENSIYIFEVDTGTLNEAGLTDPYLPTYLVKIAFTKSTIEWERYLNKVQK